jgi:hypothetical protein
VLVVKSFKPILGTTPTRQDWCRAWLVLNRIGLSELAKALGVSKTTLSEIIAGNRANPEHIQKLVALGVPADLLPGPRPLGKPGPKPKIGRFGDAA